MRLTILALLGLLVGCADNSLLPENDRLTVQQDLQSHARYLKVAMRVTPFFRDDGKWLLEDRSLDEVDLLDDPSGNPISPGAPLGILPPGTRLRIERIEFPTSLVTAERVIYSPRYNPWVYLVPTTSDGPEAALAHGKPFILVLRPQMKTKDDVFAEIDRYLSRDDLSAELKDMAPQVQEAIAQKTVQSGMTPEEVQMAWGYPERIHIDEAQKTQQWTWPLGKQQATFKNSALLRWTDHGTAGGSPN